MDGLLEFFQYLGKNWDDLLILTYEHILMVIIGMGIALVIGILLGIICSKNERLASIILAIANLIQVFPSLALLNGIDAVLWTGIEYCGDWISALFITPYHS